MPTVNLDLQLKFLRELDDALSDALSRYSDDSAEKLAELKYMKSEVTRARRIILERMEAGEATERRRNYTENFREAAFS